MQTRKRIHKRRKTKRGGLGPEVYMITGMIAMINGLMMTFGKSLSCDTPVTDDSLPVATPVDDPGR